MSSGPARRSRRPSPGTTLKASANGTSSLARGYSRGLPKADGAGAQPDTGEHERKAGEGGHRHRLAEQQGAVDDREGRDEAGEHDLAGGASARGQAAVWDVGEAGTRVA